MSTPGQPAQQAGQAAQQVGQAVQQAGQPARQAQAGQPAQQQTQPAQPQRQQTQPQGQQSQAPTGAARPWSTPRLLRLARAGAAAAVLLTGVAATGTFSADGLNATPDVIAQQWVAAERAGVEMAHADLRAAERVAGGDDEAARTGFDEAVSQVGTDLTMLGGAAQDSTRLAQDWSGFVVGAERAAAASTGDEGEGGGDSAAPAYDTASQSARSAAETTDVMAEQHAQDLRTGSRSILTGIVGTLATLGLTTLMVWLALRSRRIINIPLLVATAITAGLTYLSINPAALPVTYDQRIAESTATATALQEVYQARQAQHALGLGLDDRWQDEAAEAEAALDELDDPGLSQVWDEVTSGFGSAQDATDGPGAAESLAATQAGFDNLEAGLRDQLDDQLGGSAAAVGRPAFITSGVALLLGLVGAGLAWSGLSQRLKEYR